jgi:hypothetical protein
VTERGSLARLSVQERWLVGTAGVWLALLAANRVFGVQLTSWKAQSVLKFAFWLVPFVLLGLAFYVRYRPVKIIVVVLAALLALVAVLPATCAGVGLSDLSNSADPTFRPIGRLSSPYGTLVLYRQDCGWPCSIDVVLLQQRALLPGIEEAGFLAGWFQADTATMTLADSGHARVTVHSLASGRDSTIVSVVRLRRSLIWPLARRPPN